MCHRHCRRLRTLFAATAAAIGLVGCRSQPDLELSRFDLVPVREELVEFSLGRYSIPIPVIVDRTDERLTRQNRLQLDFELYGLVPQNQSTHVAEAWQRRQGQIRDRVIRVCRNATVEELQEYDLTTLKANLTDVVQSQLGEREVRQLMLTEVVSQEL